MGAVNETPQWTCEQQGSNAIFSMKSFVGTFRDRRGKEQIEIQSNGTSLSTTIRGIDFTGRDFDSLTPSHQSDLFDFCQGDLCSCTLCLNIPVRLMTPDGLRETHINATVILGNPNSRGGLDLEDVRLHISQPEFDLKSKGASGGFEDEMLSLVSQLPEGFHLQTCVTCGLSDYSPAGNGCFGSLACFRDVPDEYRKVESKSDIFALWDKLTDYVQETHYCAKFEQRPKGCGYRG